MTGAVCARRMPRGGGRADCEGSGGSGGSGDLAFREGFGLGFCCFCVRRGWRLIWGWWLDVSGAVEIEDALRGGGRVRERGTGTRRDVGGVPSCRFASVSMSITDVSGDSAADEEEKEESVDVDGPEEEDEDTTRWSVFATTGADDRRWRLEPASIASESGPALCLPFSQRLIPAWSWMTGYDARLVLVVPERQEPWDLRMKEGWGGTDL